MKWNKENMRRVSVVCSVDAVMMEKKYIAEKEKVF